MENTTQRENAISDSQKKEVQRSASYPFLPITKAIEYAANLHRNYPNSIIKRDDANAVTENKGYTNRSLAACVQYGLLSREVGDGYRLTELYTKLNKPIDENERRESLLASFSSPKLYQALINDYDGHALPENLHVILLRKHNIAEKASDEAARIFIESARFAGALDDKNILRVSQAKEKLLNTQFAEIITEPITNNNIDNGEGPQIQHRQLFLSSPKNENEIESEIINLKNNRKISLSFPTDISEKEIGLIERRLDEIKYRLEIKKEGAD